jgi:hypothetical protein
MQLDSHSSGQGRDNETRALLRQPPQSEPKLLAQPHARWALLMSDTVSSETAFAA